MLTQFLSIGTISLFAAMLPGPDFAIVTKNALHSRRAGILTSIGVATAISVHLTYCIFGLALLITNTPILFNLIKYLGAGYLVYLGIQSIRTARSTAIHSLRHAATHSRMRDLTAFRQGFMCNLLNPKATMFFLALFTVVIHPATSRIELFIYAIEVILIATIWFCYLTLILTHPKIVRLLNRAEIFISLLLGILLIVFGMGLLFYSNGT